MEDQIVQTKDAASLFSGMERFSVSGSNQKEIQVMMGMLSEEGWITPKWRGMWGKLLKTSGITSYDLERVIKRSRTLDGFCPRGFVRNRLKKKDWHRYFG